MKDDTWIRYRSNEIRAENCRYRGGTLSKLLNSDNLSSKVKVGECDPMRVIETTKNISEDGRKKKGVKKFELNKKLMTGFITNNGENIKAFNSSDGGISLSNNRNLEIIDSFNVGEVKSQVQLFQSFSTKLNTLVVTKSHHMN